MRIISIFITVFLLAAFAIGISIADKEMPVINLALDNASIIVTNFSLAGTTNNSYANGLFIVIEKFVHFAAVSVIEVMRIGILFGHDNPDYFTSEFIIGIAKLLIWAMIASLLIVPMMYFLAFLIMIGIWVTSKFKRRKNGKKID